MLIEVFLPLSLAVIMLSLGVSLTLRDFLRVAVMPRAVLAGLIMQVVALPLLALAVLAVVPQPPALAFGVMILAFCPGGVTTSLLTRFAGGNVALSVTITAIVSLLSVLTVPLLIGWAAPHFMGAQAPAIDVTALGIKMALLTALPVALGVILRHFAPRVAEQIDKPLAQISALLFAVLLVAAIGQNWQAFVDNLFGVGLALMLLNVLALAAGVGVGRLLGLARGDSIAISIELGVQNAALGIAMAGLILGHGQLAEYAVPPAVYGVTMYLVTLPYVFWLLHRGRRAEALS